MGWRVLAAKRTRIKSVLSRFKLERLKSLVTAGVENLLNVLGEVGAGNKLLLELLRLGLGRDLSSEKVPEHGFGEHLLSSGGGGEDLLALGNSSAPETDTLLRIEDGRLPQHRLDTTHSSEDLLDGDIAEDLVSVLGSELFGESLTFGDDLGESLVDGLNRETNERGQ